MIKLNGIIVEQNKFPDGTLLMKADTESRHNTIEWRYESDSELFAVYCLKRHIDDLCSYTAHVMLKLYYIPNARQDRVKNTEDIFTLKYFAEIINSLNFDWVEVLDPHSSVAGALINKITQKNMGIYPKMALDRCNPDIVFYPDEGSMKRYSHFPIKYAFGIKQRDWETGEIRGLELMNKEYIKGSDVLIVDDICSRGGTFYHSAKALKEAGADKIYLYVTHCENTILEGDLLTSGLIEKVYTTNSLFTAKHEKIEVFEV